MLDIVHCMCPSLDWIKQLAEDVPDLWSLTVVNRHTQLWAMVLAGTQAPVEQPLQYQNAMRSHLICLWTHDTASSLLIRNLSIGEQDKTSAMYGGNSDFEKVRKIYHIRLHLRIVLSRPPSKAELSQEMAKVECVDASHRYCAAKQLRKHCQASSQNTQ